MRRKLTIGSIAIGLILTISGGAQAAEQSLPVRQKTQSVKSVNTKISQRKLNYTWDIRTAPIAYVAQWYTLDIAYRFANRFSTGPSAVIYNSKGTSAMIGPPSLEGYAFGWNGLYHIDQKKWGRYIGAHIYYEKYRVRPHGNTPSDNEGVRMPVVFGFDIAPLNNISLLLGLGGELIVHQRQKIDNNLFIENRTTYNKEQVTTVNPVLEAKLGVRF